jgi:hypothetical protein
MREATNAGGTSFSLLIQYFDDGLATDVVTTRICLIRLPHFLRPVGYPE